MTGEGGAGARWASATTTEADAAAAATALATDLERQLGSGGVDLLAVLFSAAHVRGAGALAGGLRERLRPGCLLGASAQGVIGTGHEIEEGPAAVALAAQLPGVEFHPFLLLDQSWKEAFEDAAGFAAAAPGVAGAEVVLAFADPFSFDAERSLAAFARHAPGVRVAGGLASAGPRPGANALLLNDWISAEGGVALAMSGALRADVVVSQGCRPIGPPLTVTRAEGNVVFELDGRPALQRAEQVLRALPAEQRGPLRNGLYVGRPLRAGASGQGDYLIRNLLGADRGQGALALGDHVAEREEIRLHVRDATTAREDLELLLAPQEFDGRAGAAFLFSCNSRGRRFYDEADGDLRPLQAALGGGVPTLGMFCAGEIGPVGGASRLHGHAASIVIVRPGGGRRS
jgi:small ligand-binding sensory domain FIST